MKFRVKSALQLRSGFQDVRQSCRQPSGNHYCNFSKSSSSFIAQPLRMLFHSCYSTKPWAFKSKPEMAVLGFVNFRVYLKEVNISVEPEFGNPSFETPEKK